MAMLLLPVLLWHWRHSLLHLQAQGGSTSAAAKEPADISKQNGPGGSWEATAGMSRTGPRTHNLLFLDWYCSLYLECTFPEVRHYIHAVCVYLPAGVRKQEASATLGVLWLRPSEWSSLRAGDAAVLGEEGTGHVDALR